MNNNMYAQLQTVEPCTKNNTQFPEHTLQSKNEATKKGRSLQKTCNALSLFGIISKTATVRIMYTLACMGLEDTKEKQRLSVHIEVVKHEGSYANALCNAWMPHMFS